jgi:hypothetical protein
MKKLIVFLVAFGLVFGFAVTAAMADASLYGSARFRTYWHDKDKEYVGTNYDDEDLEWRMGYLTRWGANFKSGDITGKVELDTRDADGNEGSSEIGDVRVRHVYGEWDFGAGKLLIGQTFNPCTVYMSGIGVFSGGLQKFGGMGLSYFRTSMIRLTFGNLKLAFMSPDTSDNLGLTTVDTELPRVEARYTLKLEPVTLDFMGGWQSYDVVNATDQEDSVDCYIAGLYAQVKFGAGYFKAIGTYAQNGGNYGLWTGTVIDTSAIYEGGQVKDADCYGSGAVLGYKVSDMITLEAGYMKADGDHDRNGNYEDEAQAYGILCKITPAPGVVIQPEIVIDDREDVTQNGVVTEEGQDTIVGVFWMINFK